MSAYLKPNNDTELKSVKVVCFTNCELSKKRTPTAKRVLYPYGGTYHDDRGKWISQYDDIRIGNKKTIVYFDSHCIFVRRFTGVFKIYLKNG